MSVAYKLHYGSQLIDFTVIWRKRRTLAISVLPDTSVEVVAPITASEADVLKRVTKRAGWVCKQIRDFRQYLPRTPKRRYVAGETHLYLGRRYRLKVIRDQSATIKVKRGFIEVHTTSTNRAQVRDQLQRWQRERANECFRTRLEVCLQKFPHPGKFRPTGLIVRQMNVRWGSMSVSGRLMLNRALLQAAVSEIDYVITHELCHRTHHHHGRAFLDLLARVMPDWEKRKRSLERRLA
jgi:predicted metal-dependent hydrolase